MLHPCLCGVPDAPTCLPLPLSHSTIFHESRVSLASAERGDSTFTCQMELTSSKLRASAQVRRSR
jgi:hypothetical protein